MTRDNLDTGLKFLQDVATQQAFKPWEVKGLEQVIREDLARVPAQIRAVDLLHRAAFRKELGNSVVCAKHHVGKISPECLQHYIANNFTSNRGAVVGVGIDHQLLVGYAKNLFLETGAADIVASKYHGSADLRVDKASDLASVAIATQGGALSNQKEAISFAVLQYVAGISAVTKHGSVNGALGKVVSQALGKPFTFSTLNASYTDNGLFGFVLTAEAREIGKVSLINNSVAGWENWLSFNIIFKKAIDAAVKALKSGSVSSADVTRAKEQLKVTILESLNTKAGLAADLTVQAVLTGQVQNANELVAAIDAITVSDVNAVSIFRN